MRFGTEDQIWEQLEKDLKCEIDACIRDYYEWRQFTEQVMEGEEGSYDELKEDAERLFRCIRDQRVPPQGTKDVHSEEILGDRRSDLMSKLWADLYNKKQSVKEFRDKYMEGRKLEGEDEIDEWLAAQAGEEVLDYLDKQPDVLGPSLWHKAMFDLTFDYYDPRMRIDFAEKDSVLAKLRDLAYELHSGTSWTKGQAVWFILTGEPPKIRLLSSTTFTTVGGVHKTTAQIIMHIDPRVAPSEVLAVYRSQRKRVLKSQRDHDLSEKQVELIMFYDARTTKPIEDLHSEWNRLFPNWYIEQQGNFRRDLNRALDKLLSTGVLSIFGSQPKKKGKSP